MNETTHDIIIIGGGPAGLTAGIYSAREMFDTLLLEKTICGGLAADTDLIENYPGFPEGINGRELMVRFKEQAQGFGTQVVEFKEIKKVEPLEGKIKIETDKETYCALAVIIASGSIPKKLGIPGEERLRGKGVSYCATCDGPLYKDKDVLVVGGGDAAAEEALFLTKFAQKVTLIHRRDELRAARIFQERLQKNKKINLLLSHIPLSINGRDYVDSITMKDLKTNEEKKIEVCGVFMYIGFLPNTKFLEGIVELDNLGYIKTNEKMQTSVPRIYAVGDVRSKNVRQIDVACGEATIAVVSLRDYLIERRRKL
ncbi:MAG: thioredoxin-disulfide reductase [Candidatus Omnitrophica bacterium]|nr:thioredoxin-disulfide reductase [Candidatus Omnitrophota bacterium]